MIGMLEQRKFETPGLTRGPCGLTASFYRPRLSPGFRRGFAAIDLVIGD